MGEEWAAPEPFLYFSDLGPDLGPSVTEGRRREFAAFEGFGDGDAGRIPDPQDPATAAARRSTGRAVPARAPEWLATPPRAARPPPRRDRAAPGRRAAPARPRRPLGPTALEAEWVFPGGRVLSLVANLGAEPAAIAPSLVREPARRLYALNMPADPAAAPPAWSVAWTIQEGAR